MDLRWVVSFMNDTLSGTQMTWQATGIALVSLIRKAVEGEEVVDGCGWVQLGATC